VVLGAVVALGLGLAWVLWVVLFHSRPQVTSEMVGFHVQGQHAVNVHYAVVRRTAAVRASCLLRAYADDHTVVGELVVPVGTGTTTRTLASTMRTERRATTVDLVGCTAPGQHDPR
jgi:hypothetical protein